MAKRWQQRERRACLMLLSAAVAFVVCQQFGGWLLLHAWPALRFVGLEEHEQRAKAVQGKPVVAFLGSSRFGNGIKVTELKERWAEWGLASLGQPERFAVPAGDFVAMEFVFQRLRADGLRPSMLVLELSPETIAERTFWLNFHVIRQLAWGESLSLGSELLQRNLLRKHLLGQAFPLWMHRQALRYELTRWMIPEMPARAAGVLAGTPEQAEAQYRSRAAMANKPLAMRIEQGLKPLRLWFQAQPYQVGGPNWEALLRLLRQAEGEHIPVLLVAVPVSSPHRALYTAEVEGRFQAALHELRQRHPWVRMQDARDLIPDDGFEDNHHLTMEGGLRFSRRLAEVLRSSDQALLRGSDTKP